MNTEQFSNLVVKIWRLRARRIQHIAAGNQRAARNVNTRMEKLCKVLAQC